MPATKCNETGFWYVEGYITKRKYWGSTARDAEQNAQLYFYR
jgi:hypothetical protein